MKHQLTENEQIAELSDLKRRNIANGRANKNAIKDFAYDMAYGSEKRGKFVQPTVTAEDIEVFDAESIQAVNKTASKAFFGEEVSKRYLDMSDVEKFN